MKILVLAAIMVLCIAPLAASALPCPVTKPIDTNCRFEADHVDHVDQVDLGIQTHQSPFRCSFINGHWVCL